MAHYEMYFCLPSSAYDSAVGDKINALILYLQVK